MSLLESIQRLILIGTRTLNETERQKTLNELADPRGYNTHGYDRFQRYYDGEAGCARLTGRLREFLEAEGVEYVENFCETIVDALAQVLELNGVVQDKRAQTTKRRRPAEVALRDEQGVPLAPGDPAWQAAMETRESAKLAEEQQRAIQDDQVAEFSDWVTRVWQQNGMEELQGIVHTQVPMKGDGYIVVDWDQASMLPRFTWNDPSVVRPVYDEHGAMILAAKTWTEARSARTNPLGDPVRRLNLYFPDRVEKWFTTSSVDPRVAVQTALWAPHEDHTDEEWPIPWVDHEGEPLGIAVKHFRNKPKGKAMGRSELASVLPQQNLLTKQLVDLMEVLDYQGAAQRYATGIRDGTFRSSAGTVWTSENENARFGQFDPTNPQGTMEAIEHTMRRMASRSQTPLHQLMSGGQNPAAETWRAGREPLVRKAKDRHTSYGRTWVDIHTLGVKLQQLHDPGFEVPEHVTLTPSWENPESSNAAEELQAAEVKHRLGVSRHTLLAELGYDPEEEAERRKSESAASASAMVDAFNRGAGQDPDTGGNGRPPAGVVPPPG